jgi:hypothetical protein
VGLKKLSKLYIKITIKIKYYCRMTFAPGKVQSQSMTGCRWERDLDIDLERLRTEYNTHALISLMGDNEYLYR